MKPGRIKLISIIVCITVMISVVMLTRTELHGTSAKPLLFYNDRIWTQSVRYPAEKKYENFYIPLNLFVQLPDVDVQIYNSYDAFIIIHGSYYLSFTRNHDFVIDQNKERMYMPPAKYHGEDYVPAKAVCQYVNLIYEEMTNPLTGETVIRICDGNQTLSFEELLRRRYPEFLESETTELTTTAPPVTEPPVTVPPETSGDTGGETTAPPRVLGERTIYLTIEDSPGAYTSDILDVLDEYGYKATFFVVGDACAKNPAILSQIAAGGHAIGLHTMSHNTAKLKSADDILADIETENTLLSRIIKQKSHIWRAPEGSDKLGFLDADAERLLNESGYIIWDANITAPSAVRTASAAASSVISAIWKNETAIIRFSENKLTAETLRLVLDFISENRGVCDVRCITPAIKEYNRVR